MKKFIILALALTFVAGMAYAEDEKFSLSGQYRWEMYSFTNEGFLDEDWNKQEYFDQRFRLRSVFTPADGVMAVLRGDYAEDQWGDIGYRPNAGHDTIMIDEAYVDLTKGMFNIKAGLDGFGGFGHALSTDYQGTNVRVSGNFEPITVNVMWAKLSEGAAWVVDDNGTPADPSDDTTQSQFADGDDGDPSADDDMMGAEVVFGAEAFSVGGFYATRQNKATEDTKNVLGVHGKTSFGKIGIWAEVDMYSGSNDNTDVDYTGTNFAANAQMGVNEQLTVGLDVFYATGNDDEDDQISFLTDDWGYVPLDHGPFQWIQSTGINVHEVEDDAGSQGLNVYGTFMAMEELAIFANVGYVGAQTEDPDDDDVYVSSYTVFSVGASYTFLPGTSFNLKYENTSVDGEEINDDARTRIMGMLKVNF
jgi:hypothetical protein